MNPYLIVRLKFKGNQFLFQREKHLEVESRFNDEREEQIRIYRSNCELEIKLQRSTIFSYTYYGQRVKSRKFEYRYIQNTCILAILQILKGYHKSFQIVDCVMTNLQKIRLAKIV